MAAVAAFQPYPNAFEARLTPAFTHQEVSQGPFEAPAKESEHPKREPLLVDVHAWPAHFDSPMAWTGQDFKNPSSYTYHLSQDELLEIDNALKHFQGEILFEYHDLLLLSNTFSSESRPRSLGRRHQAGQFPSPDLVQETCPLDTRGALRSRFYQHSRPRGRSIFS